MKISRRGQVTIPKHLRERFGLHHDVEVEVSPTAGGVFIRKKETAQNLSGPVFLVNRAKANSEEEAVRLSRMLNSSCETDIREDHPVNRCVGILDNAEFDIDEYIEEIRGR